MKYNELQWAVYDITNEVVVGQWTDVCDAEEFLQENESPNDVWAVFHTADIMDFAEVTQWGSN